MEAMTEDKPRRPPTLRFGIFVRKNVGTTWWCDIALLLKSSVKVTYEEKPSFLRYIGMVGISLIRLPILGLQQVMEKCR